MEDPAAGLWSHVASTGSGPIKNRTRRRLPAAAVLAAAAWSPRKARARKHVLDLPLHPVIRETESPKGRSSKSAHRREPRSKESWYRNPVSRPLGESPFSPSRGGNFVEDPVAGLGPHVASAGSGPIKTRTRRRSPAAAVLAAAAWSPKKAQARKPVLDLPLHPVIRETPENPYWTCPSIP